MAELKPGLVEIHFTKDDKEPAKYFVSGGFALTHENSTTDIAAVEACKLEDLDEVAAKAQLAEAKGALSSAAEGSADEAKAQIAIDVNTAICRALGVAV